jgi:spore maturation protein CgeB
MNIAFFGSSLVSAYWNGAATYYRGLIRALAGRGHRITFYEPDAYDRQKHRDIEDPEWARVVVYSAEGTDEVLRCVEEARRADLVVKTSGVGVFDELLDEAVLSLKRAANVIVFWDVDAPATLDRVNGRPVESSEVVGREDGVERVKGTNGQGEDPFRKLIPLYDLILTYGGGEPVAAAYRALGARDCVPIYNALDPSTHHPVERDERFAADLGFLGNRLPDRERRVEQFFLEPAARLVGRRFLLGGSGWRDKPMPSNVNYVGHVYTRDHNAFNCTPLAVLNISRESMARYGFSPATRVFEAAGAGACLITDWFEGVETFLEPEREILVARDGNEVAEQVERLTPGRALAVGEAALRRVLAEHTYDHRAKRVEEVLGARVPDPGFRIQGNSMDGERWMSDVARSTGAASGTSDVNSSTFDVQSDGAAGLSPGSPNLNPLRIVIIGLTITSSWGNGHGTTYRGLVRELVRRGHQVLFLEQDMPWFAGNRDMPQPPWGRTELYTSAGELKDRFADEVRAADLVIVGSYVPDGVAVGEWATSAAKGVVAFYDIDTPVTLAKLSCGDCEYLSPELISKYDMYLSFAGGPVLDLLEREYRSRCARPLYCSVDPELYFPEAMETQWDMGYLGTYSADRQPPLDRLMLEPARRWNGGRFVVAGPKYPKTIEWPSNVERIYHLSPAEHRHFYNRQRFTLNVTRSDMVRAGYSPSVRLFEAAACEVPIISDQWEGIETFLEPGREILLSEGPEEVLSILRGMDEGQRRQIGAAARRRVLAEHTAAHRAMELEQYAEHALSARA